MKVQKISIILLLLLFVFSGNYVSAQVKSDTGRADTLKTYIIVKNDGSEFVGKILSQDAREVLVLTKDRGEIIIPKHEIKEIKQVDDNAFIQGGQYISNEVFATRYFIATNGLPIEKGESYIQWNLFGPDIQFGVAKNFGVGVMTSWIGMPIVATAKYTINLDHNLNLGIGMLAGTGSWAAPDFALALPFAAITLGDRKANINFSAGYGAMAEGGSSSGRLLVSLAGMAKVAKKVSLVFESFVAAPNNTEGDNMWALIIPGIRLQTEKNKAFQFGFGGLYINQEMIPAPIPIVQWYRML